MSIVESIVSVTAGYLITVWMQFWLYPLFGIIIPVNEALLLSAIIVFVTFLKNFSVRRLFNFIYMHTKKRL